MPVTSVSLLSLMNCGQRDGMSLLNLGCHLYTALKEPQIPVLNWPVSVSVRHFLDG